MGRYFTHIVAAITVLREGPGQRLVGFEVAQVDAGRENVHLPPGVVDIVFTKDVEAVKAEDVGEAGAIGGAAPMPDVQGAGGVGGDELQLQALADAVPVGAEALFFGMYPLNDGVKGGRLQKEIDEAGTGNLGAGNPVRGRQRCDDVVGDVAGLAPDCFGVHYERWYSEGSLMDTGAVDTAVAALEKAGHCYTREGALWFRATAFDDDKDRVLRRDNGAYTYFASDVAYHAEKFARGFTHVIDMWGADHHGYVPRVKAALRALGFDDQQLEVVLVQFAILYRGTEKISMSTRAGEFVTLRELREEVGNDAARFFYVLRRADQHLDFDLELAKKHSEENPVFYIQYAHARVYSLLRQAAEKGLSLPSADGIDLEILQESREIALADALWRFPEVVATAARDREPHQIAFYLRELAAAFHTYYNSTRILVEETPLRHARLTLCLTVAQTIANGLRLLGVSAPEQM